MSNNWSDYERFLKPVHLKGQAVTLTIVKMTEEETHPQRGKSVSSPVLWFRELPFGLIVSPTNRQTLIALYGDKVADCIGKPITVQSVAVKVAGNDRQPLRILKQRPSAPHIETTTGEIVDPKNQAEHNGNHQLPAQDEPPVTYEPKPERIIEQPATTEKSELDQIIGPRQHVNELLEQTPERVWPATEAEFTTWAQKLNISGKAIYVALGTEAKTWIRMNAGKSWADVAKTIAALLGK